MCASAEENTLYNSESQKQTADVEHRRPDARWPSSGHCHHRNRRRLVPSWPRVRGGSNRGTDHSIGRSGCSCFAFMTQQCIVGC